MSNKMVKIIQMFNNGEWEETLQPHFETIDRFLKIVDKFDLMEMLEPFNPDLEDYENQILIALLGTRKRQETIDMIIGKLSDITVENGKIMCDFRYRGELSSFFEGRGNRDYNYEEIVKRTLGDGFNDLYFNDTTDDVYRDVKIGRAHV